MATRTKSRVNEGEKSARAKALVEARRDEAEARRRAEEEAAAGALERIGPAAVPALVAALGDAEPGVRRGASEALGRIGPGAAEAVPALVAALDPAKASAPIDVLERATEIMGGSATIGRAIDNEIDLLEAMRRGLPGAVLGALKRAGMTREEIGRLIVPSSEGDPEYARRRDLTPEESDRAVRCARVLASAEDVFGSTGRAHDWLRRPKPVLDGRAPMDVLDSEIGARIVEDLLQGVAHGIAA